MKPTHKIKETGVELIESEHNENLLFKDNCYVHKNIIKALGLTIEPIVREKKRLYAYYHDDHENVIYFSTNRNRLDERADEYDIEYPEE